MKTAIQEFIDEVEDIMMVKGQLWWHERKKKALEKEKEQIKKANIEGTEHGYRESHVFGIDARPYSEKRAEEYYNLKYNQNNL
jgi:hypothetical protein